MLKIRYNVFETNSSSMHSIAVCKKEMKKITTLVAALAEDPNMKVVDGVLVIGSDDEIDFDWGFDILDTVYGRIRYAIAEYGKTEMELVMDAVHTAFPEITSIKLPTSYSGEENYTGRIDHQSCGRLDTHLKTYGYTLADFILDCNALVIIDNDNSCHLGTVVEAGIFNHESLANSRYMVDEYGIDGNEDEEYDGDLSKIPDSTGLN